MKKWLAGVDEAGRGPLAGPLAVGVVLVEKDFDWDLIPGVNDSKKLTPKNREAIFRLASSLQKSGKLTYAVATTSALQIDKVGLARALAAAKARAIRKVVKEPKNTLIKLDGGLKAPEEFTHQETIIKGDQKEKVIGLASIMAKVTRDKYMERIAAQPQFAPYSFEIHKGYGTKQHRETIKKIGLSEIHRLSFCTRLI